MSQNRNKTSQLFNLSNKGREKYKLNITKLTEVNKLCPCMHQVSSYYSVVIISCDSPLEDPGEKHVRELASGEKVKESFLGESKDRKRRCFIA